MAGQGEASHTGGALQQVIAEAKAQQARGEPDHQGHAAQAQPGQRAGGGCCKPGVVQGGARLRQRGQVGFGIGGHVELGVQVGEFGRNVQISLATKPRQAQGQSAQFQHQKGQAQR